MDGWLDARRGETRLGRWILILLMRNGRLVSLYEACIYTVVTVTLTRAQPAGSGVR